MGYVSFLIFWLRQSNFDMVVWYMFLYGGLVYALIWCFGICLDMVFGICFDICFGI